MAGLEDVARDMLDYDDLQRAWRFACGHLDRFRAVHFGHGGISMGRLVDRGLTRGGWIGRVDFASLGHAPIVDVARFERRKRMDSNAVDSTCCAVVVELLSRCRAWRRGVHRAANVLCQGRRARGGGHLVVQCGSLCLRPWPWILVALASIIVFPDLDALREAFPGIAEDKVGHDLAYPAMLSLLPSGLLGLVAASLLAAFMSTMSTQLNLGASYLVHDVYGRFMNPDASGRQKVWAGQIATGVSLVLGAGLGLLLTDAGQAFNLLLLLGAGTGGLFLLRWFWWRILQQLKSLRWSFPCGGDLLWFSRHPDESMGLV